MSTWNRTLSCVHVNSVHLQGIWVLKFSFEMWLTTCLSGTRDAPVGSAGTSVTVVSSGEGLSNLVLLALVSTDCTNRYRVLH